MNEAAMKICAPGILIAMVALSGCYGGRTGRFIVPLEDAGAVAGLRPISVASLEREEDGMRLIAVGVKPWGKFDDKDQANIRDSLEDTLAVATRDRVAGNTEVINIHIVIRKYVVGVSNNAAAVWAGLDWCAAGADRRVLFQETFYATSTGRFVVTTGGIKDDVNRAIVRRIAKETIALASGSPPAALNVPDTYSAFDEAAATMPATLQSWGMLAPIQPVPIFVPGTAPERFASGLTRIREPIDWQNRLDGK